MKFTITRTKHNFDDDPLEHIKFAMPEHWHMRLRQKATEGGVFISLYDIEELTDFINDVGQVVMDEGSIEIYDDYRPDYRE